jgi:tetratricopeptide (TPR) repeat protein
MTRIPAILLLAATIGASSASRARSWQLIRGRNVVVIGQQSAKALRDVAVEIEQFRMVIGNLLRGAKQPLPMPTLVYLFDDENALKPFVPLYNGKPAVLGGYCHCGSSDDVNFIVAGLARYSESSAIIFHEYAHLLVHNAARDVPVWLNEGLAEYYSTFALKNGGRQADIGRPIARHVQLLRGRVLPVAQLLAVDETSALYNEGERRSIFYAESWALTHYLLMERPNGGASIVNRYLTAVAAGTPSEKAFVDATGVSLKEMDTELLRYVSRPIFSALTFVLADRVDVDEPERARPISAAEADARLGDVQMRVGRINEAAVRIEAAAAAGPDVAQAQLALALLRFRQERKSDAWAPLEKAAALAPDDFIAQFTYALTLLRREGESEAQEKALAERAYAALTRALAVNPQSASALAWLAYADLVLDVRLPEARDATTRAMALAPGRLDYRIQLAQIYVRQNDIAEGRRLLADLAQVKNDQALSSRARTLLDRLDEHERAAAEQRALEAAAREAAAREAAAHEAALREAVVDARADPAAATSIPSRLPTPDDSKLPTFRLRKVRTGEERAYGELVSIECGPGGVRFSLRVGSRVIVAVAKRMEDVELAAYGNDKELAIACGPRSEPDTVYLTWRRADAAQHAAGLVGTAVAVEFVPRDYLP